MDVNEFQVTIVLQQSPAGNTSEMLKWNLNSGQKEFIILRDMIGKQTGKGSWGDSSEQNLDFKLGLTLRCRHPRSVSVKAMRHCAGSAVAVRGKSSADLLEDVTMQYPLPSLGWVVYSYKIPFTTQGSSLLYCLPEAQSVPRACPGTPPRRDSALRSGSPLFHHLWRSALHQLQCSFPQRITRQ